MSKLLTVFLYLSCSCSVLTAEDVWNNELIDAAIKEMKSISDERVQNLLNNLQQAETPSHKSEALLEIGLMYLYGNATVTENSDMAIKFLNESAALGHPHAQHIMAVGYSTGMWGLERNEAKAILYLYFASLGGDIGASMALGYRYLHGLGVTESCETAILYYEMAANAAIRMRDAEPVPPITYDKRPARLNTLAEGGRSAPKDSEVVDYYHYSADKGDADAMVNLGSVYYYGARGVQQDLEKAAKFFTLAVQHGSISAHANLGHMYAHGLGVPMNDHTAFHHFHEAVLAGNAAGQNGLGYMYLHGKGTEKDIAKAMQMFSKAAKQGNSDALYNLGVISMGATGQEPDYHRALQNFHIAAQHSHTLALHKLAHIHSYGLATSRSCSTACEYFKGVAERGPWSKHLAEAASNFADGYYNAAFVTYAIKAEEGFEAAQSNAAWMIENGLGYVDENHGEVCVRLYKLAAVQGNVEANLKIGDLNYYGKGGLPVNYERATAHYRRASKRNNAQAMFNLGIMHEHGIGLPQDLFLAKRWYDLAAETSSEAYAPVALALLKLRVHMYLVKLYNSYFGDSAIDSSGEVEANWWNWHGFLAPDNIAIIVLTVVLATLITLQKFRNGHL